MWLPKDERRLLAGYYTQIGDIKTEKVYRIAELRALLKCCGHRKQIPKYGDHENDTGGSGDLKSMKRESAKYVDVANRIRRAHGLLAERGLLKITPHEHEHDVVIVEITVNGYDLGRRYSNPLESTGIWFQEYRNHWIWLIVACFGGALIVKMIDFVASVVVDR